MTELSIVTTMYYSQPYLEEFYKRIKAAAEQITHDYEIVLVNDGSPDDSLTTARRLYQQDDRVKVIDLSRNFGHHKAIMTGLAHTTGDLVFLIDSDLEEPPESLLEFYQVFQNNDADVVYGVQQQRKTPMVDALFGRLFYKLFNLLSPYPIPQELLIVRLMTRRYVNQLIAHREQTFIIAGLWTITGFKQIPLPIDKSYKGRSTYTFLHKLRYLVYSVVAFSNKPLFYIAILGLLLTLSAIFFVVLIVLQYLRGDVGISGWTSVIVSVWLFGGLTILMVGVIAIYLSVIFTEVKARPYTVIRQIYNRGQMREMPQSQQHTNFNSLLQRVNAYYTGKIEQHGANHLGVDWKSTESQELRFDQILKLHCGGSEPFSILDYGCGYGALAHYAAAKGLNFNYVGYDISEPMVKAAYEKVPPSYNWQFTTDFSQPTPMDYVISSGIFNVKFDTPDDIWKQYMLDTISKMWTFSTKGIAFNVLTSYSDVEYRRNDLYYADPLFWFDYCKRQFSRQVTLLHDYGLYEFTMLVRRI